MAILVYWILRADLFLLQAGVVTFKTSIIKGGVEKFALKQPIFLVGIYLRFRYSYFLPLHHPAIPNRSPLLGQSLLSYLLLIVSNI